MSAIKKFFEKKKREAKFKMAGPGQKLGDAESAAAQRATREAAAAAAASRQGASTSRSGHLQRLFFTASGVSKDKAKAINPGITQRQSSGSERWSKPLKKPIKDGVFPGHYFVLQTNRRYCKKIALMTIDHTCQPLERDWLLSRRTRHQQPSIGN